MDRFCSELRSQAPRERKACPPGRRLESGRESLPRSLDCVGWGLTLRLGHIEIEPNLNSVCQEGSRDAIRHDWAFTQTIH